jgi:glyoxylase-like metal-dependent hydrolase (beta-lactamase superfamily II)
MSDHSTANRFKSYTGGVFDTNAFFFDAPGGGILFDAPPGADVAFADSVVRLLVLTHGHFDHVSDTAAILRRQGCPVVCHPDTVPMVSEEGFFARWGFALEIETFVPTRTIDESTTDLLGEPVRVLHVPGHCPGSVCLYFPAQEVVVGGDVLFRGGVGRWDLPGGDRDELFSGIRTKLWPLGDRTVVLPGHGPATTIGREKRENPYVKN